MKKAIWICEIKSTNIRIATTKNWICQNGNNPKLEIGNCGGVDLHLSDFDIIYFNPSEDWAKYKDSAKLDNQMCYDDAILAIADYLCSMNGCLFLMS